MAAVREAWSLETELGMALKHLSPSTWVTLASWHHASVRARHLQENAAGSPKPAPFARQLVDFHLDSDTGAPVSLSLSTRNESLSVASVPCGESWEEAAKRALKPPQVCY